MIECVECHEKHKQLTEGHFRAHKDGCKTLAEYKEKYPDAPTICESTSKLHSERFRGDKNPMKRSEVAEEQQKTMRERGHYLPGSKRNKKMVETRRANGRPWTSEETVAKREETMQERGHYDEGSNWRRKLSENNPMKNDPKVRERQSISQRKWANSEEGQADLRKARKAAMKTMRLLPSGLEAYVMAIIAKYELPLQYTGNAGKDWKLSKHTPDFASLISDSVIEINGYWHGEDETGRTKKEEEARQTEHYRKYGLQCHILWENEVHAMSEEQLRDWLLGVIK